MIISPDLIFGSSRFFCADIEKDVRRIKARIVKRRFMDMSVRLFLIQYQR